MANGCVPVVIQDHVYQPYESVLPYQEFSIRLAKSDIPKVGQSWTLGCATSVICLVLLDGEMLLVCCVLRAR